jgi:hypothetical protein
LRKIDPLGCRNVVRVEFGRRANIHNAKPWTTIPDPLCELESRYVILLQLHIAGKGANIHPRVRGEVWRSRECREDPEAQCCNNQSTR